MFVWVFFFVCFVWVFCFCKNLSDEMTKITNSNQSHKSYKKYKSENGRTRTFEYTRDGIRCHGGVSNLTLSEMFVIDSVIFT
jgi:hypothetical protein